MKRSADLPMTIRPVIGLADEYASGFVDPMHSHPRGQLSLGVTGVMSFTTDEASYLLPPNRGIWLPPGTPHSVRFRGKVVGHTLYIDPAFVGGGERTKVFTVTPLVRALIEEIVTFEPNYNTEGREGRLVRILLDEIENAPDATIQVAMPTDRRLRRVCDLILADPASPRDLDEWAKVAGMGRRTFTRLFKEEIGTGLATWRQQVRVMEAVSLLSEGQSITSVAFHVGYESPSAFTAMFHRTLGAPPSTYGKH